MAPEGEAPGDDLAEDPTAYDRDAHAARLPDCRAWWS